MVEMSEKSSSIMKLPLGFRFHPTDEEIIIHYLRRKVFSIPLPAPAVSDFDVFQTHPKFFPGDLKEKRYFFSERKGGVCRDRVINCNDFGYWKAIGKNEKTILIPGTNQAIGKKKSFVFHEMERQKTEWVMDQYCLVVYHQSTPNSLQRCMFEFGDWVVSRVYQKKNKAKNKGVKSTNTENSMGSNVIMDLVSMEGNDNELGPPQPSSSSEVSCCKVSATTLHEFEEEACSTV